jgi:pyruvate/2-oxoglutarate dehydrogenase complex dihydrolipoamide dehydrogenase (E3) component
MEPARVKSEITIADLLARTQHVVGREVEVIRSQLLRNHVALLGGTVRFEDPQTVTVRGEACGEHHRHRREDRDRYWHEAGPTGRGGVRRGPCA